MYNMGGNGISLADIAALNNNNNNWGNDWWAWIIFAAMFGWGGNGWGFGGNGGNGTQAVEAAVQRGFDTQTIVSKLDGINTGICSLGYDQLGQMNSLGNTVQRTGWDLAQLLQSGQIANMQQYNALVALLNECCCKDRTGEMQIINQMDRNNCQTNWNMEQMTQRIIQNDNDNYRRLNDQFNDFKLQQKDAEIAALRAALNDCSRDSALQGWANYVVQKVNPQTQPAYLTCNPNTGNVFPQSSNWPNNFNGNGNCGWNNGCNNGCGGCCN